MSFSPGGDEKDLPDADFLFSRPVCSWCRSGPPHGEPLKRCRGCNTTVYCGRECQAAAWSKHRPLCRRNSTAFQAEQSIGFAGYATAISLGEAMNEWVRINSYNLSVIVHTMLRRTGGVDVSCRLGLVVIINVSSWLAVIPNSEDDDPATAFSIRMTRVSGPEAAPRLPSPESMERLARPAGEYEEETGLHGDLAKTPPAGFVPIVFSVDESESALTTYCPVYRALHHPDDAPLGEEMTTVVGDLCSVFVEFIRN